MSTVVTEPASPGASSPADTALLHVGQGHAAWVRICHWTAVVAVLCLLVSGWAMLMTNPRLYWGEVGNSLVPPLFELPVSRNYQHGGWSEPTPFFDTPGSPVTANRGYEILNLNGWARSLHFLASWFLVAVGCAYLLAGLFSGHLARNLLPRPRDLAPRTLWADVASHLRLRIPRTTGGPPYGILQRCAYSLILFIVVPLIVLTGLTMSPTVTASYPLLLDLFGGYQSARTLHFFGFAAVALFLLVHLVMVVLSGAGRQLRAMTLGQQPGDRHGR